MKAFISKIPLVGLSFLLLLSDSACAKQATDLLTGDTRKAYDIIKFLIKAEQGLKDLTTDGDGGGSDYFPLSTCSSSASEYVVEGNLRNTLVGLAYDVVIAEARLQQFKYPVSVWRKPLGEFERRWLQNIENGSRINSDGESISDFWLAPLSEEINQNISNAGLNLKVTEPMAECGGPPATFKIVVRPGDAKAQLIPEFFYQYCRKVGLDPSNEDACDLWHAPISNGDRVALGGVYRYRIVRNGKHTPISSFDLDGFFDGDTLELPR